MDFVKNTDFIENPKILQNTIELKYYNKTVWNINLNYNSLKSLSERLDMIGASSLYSEDNDIITLYFLKNRFIIEKNNEHSYLNSSSEFKDINIQNKSNFFFANINYGNIINDSNFKKCIIYDTDNESVIMKKCNPIIDYWYLKHWWVLGIQYSYNDISTRLKTIPRTVYKYINNIKLYDDIRYIILDKITYFKVSVNATQFYSTMIENNIDFTLNKHIFYLQKDSISFDNKNLTICAKIEKI
mgnify:CR=1 FL=1|jgi:hypothetical protein